MNANQLLRSGVVMDQSQVRQMNVYAARMLAIFAEIRVELQ